VSEPDMRSAAEAKAYAQELYNLARYSGASDANLYYGNMRFDVNVSVHKPGTPFGTRTETKNLNSFRNVERAVEYEIDRQIEAVEKGEKIRQETRGWNEAKQKTYAMRSKEDADEYRYFPEPDLPPLVIPKAMADEAGQFEFLPNDLRKLLAAAGIAPKEAAVLVNEPDLAALWHAAHQLYPKHSRFVFTWLTGPEIKLREVQGEKSDLTPHVLNEVAQMVSDGLLSSTNARDLLTRLRVKPYDPHALAREAGLLQESDESELGKIVDQVIADHPQAVADFRAGNQRAFGALVGASMKATQGKGNPPLINKLLKERLSK